MNNEFSAIVVLRVPNCHDDDGILIAAVNRFGCIGPNSTEVPPSLFFNNDAQTAEGQSTTETITPVEDESNPCKYIRCQCTLHFCAISLQIGHVTLCMHSN